jgi:hypothetical protein
MNGNVENPKRAQNGPAAATADSEPKGPPETEKKIKATRPHKETGRPLGNNGVLRLTVMKK